MSEKTVKTKKNLSNKQIKHLRGLGHKLPALVLIGKEGMTAELITAVKKELVNHELIKVKIGTNSSVNKHDAAESIPRDTGSELVQLIGKTLLLYKANPQLPKDKRIYLPKI